MRALLASVLVFALAACDGRESAPDSAAAHQTPDESPPVTDTSTSPAVEPGTPVSDRGQGGAAPPAPTEGQGGGSSPSSSGADTVRGDIRIAGSAPDSRVVVRTSSGEFAVSGSLARTIGALQGMQLWIEGTVRALSAGTLPRREISATRFAVREVNGQPALDGTLRDEGGTLLLLAADGTRTPLPGAPPALRAQVDKRVWVVMSDGGIASFGVIERN